MPIQNQLVMSQLIKKPFFRIEKSSHLKDSEPYKKEDSSIVQMSWH